MLSSLSRILIGLDKEFLSDKDVNLIIFELTPDPFVILSSKTKLDASDNPPPEILFSITFLTFPSEKLF